MPPTDDPTASAIAILTEQAREVRALYARWEVATHGHEWSPAELMSGFVVDVGDLTRLVMAKTGSRHVDDLDSRLAHEMADCLWSVLVLADRLEVDLADAFSSSMEQLADHLRDQLAAEEG